MLQPATRVKAIDKRYVSMRMAIDIIYIFYRGAEVRKLNKK